MAVNVKQFGAIGDGSQHPLSSRYSTLAAAQLVYPHALSLTDEIDWCAIQAACNMGRPVEIPDGLYYVNRTITDTTGGVRFRGSYRGAVQIRRYEDFGPTFKFGGLSTLIDGLGLQDMTLYDFGTTGHVMTHANSPFHIVADNVLFFEIQNVAIANVAEDSFGGGIALLGCLSDLSFLDVSIPKPRHKSIKITRRRLSYEDSAMAQSIARSEVMQQQYKTRE